MVVKIVYNAILVYVMGVSLHSVKYDVNKIWKNQLKISNWSKYLILINTEKNEIKNEWIE